MKFFKQINTHILFVDITNFCILFRHEHLLDKIKVKRFNEKYHIFIKPLQIICKHLKKDTNLNKFIYLISKGINHTQA
jgi:hypothetical protein